MATSRRTTLVFTGLIGIASAAGLCLSTGCGGGSSKPESVASATPIVETAKSPLADLAARLRQSDVEALHSLIQRLDPTAADAKKAISITEAAEWLDVLAGLRAGYIKFPTSQARASVIASTQEILTKFAIEPAPSTWMQALTPYRDIVCIGLADRDVDLRATALAALGKIWGWYPGTTMLPVEEDQLGAWKNAFQAQVALKLADRDPKGRCAAIACLAAIPIDSLAAPAINYLEDMSNGHVRHQVLMSFASRPSLLTDEMIVKRLHDTEPGIPQLAELLLKTRGLTKDQISLGRLITSPKPELRASVIPLLKEYDDVDPVVWLLRLTHDPDELVRTKAMEAITGKTAPEIGVRLREMAAKDASPAIRALAGKLLAQLPDAGKTVSLPPLPGSPSLTPRAN